MALFEPKYCKYSIQELALFEPKCLALFEPKSLALLNRKGWHLSNRYIHRLVYYNYMHPKESFSYSKTFTSPDHDFFVYYEENIVANKSGLIYHANYYILYSLLFDREYISCNFKYKYEFYE